MSGRVRLPGPEIDRTGQTAHAWLGPVALTTAASIWGGMYAVTKSLFAVVPPWVLLDLRFWLALVPLGSAALWMGQWRISARDLPELVLIALVGYVGSVGMQFWGTAYAGAAMGSLITAASPALILLLAPMFLGDRLTVRSVCAVAIATGGVVLAAGVPSGGASAGHALLGSVLLFGAALTWAVYTLLGRRLTLRLPSLTVTGYVTLLGALLTLPLGLTEWHSTLGAVLRTPSVAAGILFVGWVSTALAFFLWNLGFEHVKAAAGSLFFFAQPVVGGLLGWLALGEHLSWGFGVGGVFIALAVILMTFSKAGPPDRAKSPGVPRTR